MARETFPTALDLVLRHEGGYVDHPRDPGGATNMGITIHTLRGWRGRPVSKEDVRRLTKAEAAEIYKARYWDKVCGDELPGGVDYATFDGAVNSGPSRSAKWLQLAIDSTPDGRVGPKTLDATRAADPNNTVRKIAGLRLAFLRGLSTWGTFGRGWKRRVDEMEHDALALIEGRTEPKPEPDHIEGPGLTLRRGDQGGPVRVLQDLLNGFDYVLVVDGDFGPATEAAVKDFQITKGLTVDGIVGPNTWDALIEHKD